MARTTYRIYENDAAGTTQTLKFLGKAEASSPAGAVREWFADEGQDDGKDSPTRLVVMAASALHHVSAQVETQTRLKLS